MYRYFLAIAVAVAFLAIVGAVISGHASAKDGNTSALCIKCHPKVKDFVQGKKTIHKPVSNGRCTACHNPHASRHKGLLTDGGSKLCFDCHDSSKGFAGNVVHKPVEEGLCLSCHEAHSTDTRFLLKNEGGEGCFGCHPQKVLMAGKNVHPEVKKGNCSACHDPHSSNNIGLLRVDRRKVCVKCHSRQNEKFTDAHLGYEVIGSDCLVCHSPHSSKNAGLLKASLHKPFAEKKCTICHVKGTSKVVKKGSVLCTQCHLASMPGFNKIYSHLNSSGSDNFCDDCHNPHASDVKYLLKDKEARVCFKCHGDTKTSVMKSNFIHPELKKGNCSACHKTHGSDNMFFLSKGSETCSVKDCHPKQGRFTHPVGEKIIDPRSKMPMDCDTCHNPMGSKDKFILRFKGDRELCVKCHQI